MVPHTCQPRRRYRRSASAEAVSSTSSVFDSVHQGLADAVAAGTPVDQELGHVGAVRLIFRKVHEELDRAVDASLGVARDQEQSLAARHGVGGAVPERARPVPRQRRHEADGGAADHTVDQHLAQGFDLGARGLGAEGLHPGERLDAHDDDLRDQAALASATR
jgi:hypothetical protein